MGESRSAAASRPPKKTFENRSSDLLYYTKRKKGEIPIKEYEIVLTYLNGCAGAAYPQTSFEEASATSPEAYLQAKHGKDFPQFVKEIRPNGQVVYTFDNGAVTYIYEFTEL